jgi:TRAP-type C4-dicarboxylate transport system permease small subunit
MVTTWYSGHYTFYLYQNDITIIKYYTVPQFIFFIIIPIGFFLLLIQSLRRAYAFFRQVQKTPK